MNGKIGWLFKPYTKLCALSVARSLAFSLVDTSRSCVYCDCVCVSLSSFQGNKLRLGIIVPCRWRFNMCFRYSNSLWEREREHAFCIHDVCQTKKKVSPFWNFVVVFFLIGLIGPTAIAISTTTDTISSPPLFIAYNAIVLWAIAWDDWSVHTHT